MTKIKICGLSRPEDIDTVNRLKPDYIGFMFYKPSRRYVTLSRALELKKALDPDIKAVGVFLDAPFEEILKAVQSGCLDLIQLHGHEDEGYLLKLRALTSLPVIRAFVMKEARDAEALQTSLADHLLIDSGYGGTGETFDWSLLSGVKRPYFLAGGLDPRNVRTAVRELHPFGVDVSSGVETDGLKDPVKIQAFIEAVRQEERL